MKKQSIKYDITSHIEKKTGMGFLACEFLRQAADLSMLMNDITYGDAKTLQTNWFAPLREGSFEVLARQLSGLKEEVLAFADQIERETKKKVTDVEKLEGSEGLSVNPSPSA